MKTPKVILVLLGSAGVLFAGPESQEHERRHREVPVVVQQPPQTNVPRALPPPVGQTFSRPESTFDRPSSTFSRPAPPAIGVAPGAATETEGRHGGEIKHPGGKPHDGDHDRRGHRDRHHRRHTHHIITYYPFDPYYYLYDSQMEETPAPEPPVQEVAPAEEEAEAAPPVVIDLPPGARIIRPGAPQASRPSPEKTAPEK